MTVMATGLSGSYAPDDVVFLLKPLRLAFIDVAAKEAAIQSGRRHYSEMLSPEYAPAPAYLDAFRAAFDLNRRRLGKDVARLARHLRAVASGTVVLVSLARAGTPVGVLLKRALTALGTDVQHYSVSIIRDRGLDGVAMNHILHRHRPQDLVFVDGWTGKGTIQRELARSLARDLSLLNEAPLCVVADLAGVADVAASSDDYVIPSAILNGIISGLVSRSVLHADHIGPGDFHGCVLLDHLAESDLSRWYIEAQMQDVSAALVDPDLDLLDWNENRRRDAARISTEFVNALMGRLAVRDRNRIKPGIGEATRALLRRVPDRLFVRDRDAEDVRHLLALASARALAVEVDAELPYRACAVIKTLGEE